MEHARLHGPITRLTRGSLEQAAPRAAVELLGALLVRQVPGRGEVVARIVETEAYGEEDPASHSHRNRTLRNEPMFGQPGTSYVYRSYGIHWCLNVAVEEEGRGAAVLLRAAVVLRGAEIVTERRPTARTPRELLRGPGRLTSGLDVDAPRHDRGDLIEGVGGLVLGRDAWRPEPTAIRAGPRVGVRRSPDLPWRFVLAGAPEVSPYRRSPLATASDEPAG